MSYQQQYELLQDPVSRGRAEMCVKQQAQLFAGDGRPDIKALAVAVISGDYSAVVQIYDAVVTGPNWSTLGEDGPLLAAVQAVWPTVAAARYPAP